MSVDKLVGFVDLCRAFGVGISPAETSAFVGDFGALEMEDRPFMEEAAVGALARDLDSEATVRRLFGVYFAGIPMEETSAGDNADDAESPERPLPAEASELQQKEAARARELHRDSPAPNAKPTLEQMKAFTEALERAGADREADDNPPDGGDPSDELGDPLGLSPAMMEQVRSLLGAFQKPAGKTPPGKPANNPMTMPTSPEARRLLRKMARRREEQKRQQKDSPRENGKDPSRNDADRQKTEPEDRNKSEGEQEGSEREGEQGQNGQGQGEQGQNGQGQNGQGQNGQGQGQGQGQQGQGNGQGQQGQGGEQGEGFGQGAQGRNGQGPGSEGQPSPNGQGQKDGFGGRGRGQGGTSPRQGELERIAQQLGRACAAMIAEGAVSPAAAARLAAALMSSLARAFTAQVTGALKETPSPLRQERLREALESIAGRMLAEGQLSNAEAVKLLTAADEALKLQTTLSGAGLRSLLHDPDALADLLHRYRHRRDALPTLVTKLSDALRKLLTRPSPVMARSDSGRLDFRATMRESVAYGGVPLEFRFRRRRPENEVVLALDTSGSQRAWAASAVLTAFALNRLLPRLKAYSFTTDLTDVTRYLRRPEGFIEHLEDFSGFSNYETALLQLENEGVLHRRTTLIVVGDCRDAQGGWQKEREGRYSRYIHPDSATVVERLAKRCRHVIFLNPEGESRWALGDSAAEAYRDAGATVLPVESPLHLAEQLAAFALRPSHHP